MTSKNEYLINVMLRHNIQQKYIAELISMNYNTFKAKFRAKNFDDLEIRHIMLKIKNISVELRQSVLLYEVEFSNFS